MAGSLRSMLYRTDIPDDAGTGFKFLILNIDESNALETGGLPATAANKMGLEFAEQGNDFLRIEPRIVYVEGETSTGKQVRRRFIACDPSNDLVNGNITVDVLVATGGATSEVVTCEATGVVGEKRTFAQEDDTALDDNTP